MNAVLFEVADGIATITLNRPEVRNAIDRPTAEAISAALDEFEAREDARAGVLTASGSVFSAGMDLKAFSKTREKPVSATRGGFGIVERPPAKPLIAAVEGKALGGGLEIALACDLIVAADNAAFGLPEVKRGLVAAAGGVLRLPRRIPRALAMEMVLTGDPISAGRAAEIGLVNQIVPAGATATEARDLAAAISANAPMAVRTAKLLVEESVDWPFAEAFARQAPHTDAVRSSRDAAEGARAFMEKRAPVWTNS
jgi:enoyl-CoA hydratase/carnithine racemase